MSKLAPGSEASMADAVSAAVPLRRMGTRGDIGLACVYLSSSAANYVSGVNHRLSSMYIRARSNLQLSCLLIHLLPASPYMLWSFRVLMRAGPQYMQYLYFRLCDSLYPGVFAGAHPLDDHVVNTFMADSAY